MDVRSRISCLFGHHSRGPRVEVWHDGHHYRSKCRGCGAPMVRDFQGWRLADARDEQPVAN